jgi:inositol-pentakisphosphate 2-kinase
MEISKLSDPKDWKYFGKGAANILFEYVGNNKSLEGKLLRLRLFKNQGDYISTQELYHFIHDKCKPILSDSIIDVQLVHLDELFLAQVDSHGHKLMECETFAFLLPNLLHGNYSKLDLSKNCQLYIDAQWKSVIIEMKPKWLYDNYGTNYCRTCLLKQLKGSSRHYCPLDLLYPDTISQAVEDIFSLVPGDKMKLIDQNGIPLKQLFGGYLSGHGNVFQQLKFHQTVLNLHDDLLTLTSLEDVSERLSLIMTLRDVGVFLKFERSDLDPATNGVMATENSGNFLVSSYIYDLDLKSPTKFSHWRDTEQKLSSIYNSDNPSWRHCHKVRKS